MITTLPTLWHTVLRAVEILRDEGLVFTSAVGTPLDRYNVRRSFRAITKAAGTGQEWTPRELRQALPRER